MTSLLGTAARFGGLLGTLALAVLLGACDSQDDGPLPIAQPAYLIDDQMLLFQFDLANPEAVRRVGEVTGLASSERVVGMDTRPSNGTVYLLTQTGRLYTLDVSTGAAQGGPTLAVAGTPLMLSGTAFGVDFNPVPDRLRVVSNTGQNLRINVETGETIVDGSLAYAEGDAGAGVVPEVVAAGYTNSRSGTITETRLFVLDSGRNALVLQNPPNAGTLNTVGALGFTAAATAAFDVRGADEAFAVVRAGTGSDLYRVNLATGAGTRVGPFGVPVGVQALTIPTP